jgi:hypothetical protein
MSKAPNLLGAQRKKWDEEAFEQRAKDRVSRELEEEREKTLAKAPPRAVIQRAPLDRDKARADQNLNIHGEVGKKKVRARVGARSSGRATRPAAHRARPSPSLRVALVRR